MFRAHQEGEFNVRQIVHHSGQQDSGQRSKMSGQKKDSKKKKSSGMTKFFKPVWQQNMFGLNSKYRPLNSSSRADAVLTAREPGKLKNRFQTKKNSTTYMAEGRHNDMGPNSSLMAKMSMSREVSISYRNEVKEKKAVHNKMKKQNKDFLSKYLSKKGQQKIEESKLDSPDEKED